MEVPSLGISATRLASVYLAEAPQEISRETLSPPPSSIKTNIYLVTQSLLESATAAAVASALNARHILTMPTSTEELKQRKHKKETNQRKMALHTNFT